MTPMVTDEQLSALRSLAAHLPAGAYLAGGVAVALRLRHRMSRDLDLFVPEDFDPDRLAERLHAKLEGVVVTGTAPGTLHLEIGGIPTSILTYRYPNLREAGHEDALGVRVASPEDLVCMKLSAIASRGLARDFWDLHALLTGGHIAGDLSHALELYERKFSSDDLGHVIRSLAYFGEADGSPLPRGLDRARWERIKDDFERWVRPLG